MIPRGVCLRLQKIIEWQRLYTTALDEDGYIGGKVFSQDTLDGHQGAGLRFRATAAGALVADAQDVVFEVFDHDIAAVRSQQGPDIFIHEGVDNLRLDGVAERIKILEVDIVENSGFLFARIFGIVVIDQRLFDGLDDRVDQQFPLLGRNEGDGYEPILNQQCGYHPETEHGFGKRVAFGFKFIVEGTRALGDRLGIEVELERRGIGGRLRGDDHEFSFLGFH